MIALHSRFFWSQWFGHAAKFDIKTDSVEPPYKRVRCRFLALVGRVLFAVRHEPPLPSAGCPAFRAAAASRPAEASRLLLTGLEGLCGRACGFSAWDSIEGGLKCGPR